jgi:aspartate/methionine/tyrosine aminotransferase
VINIAELSAQIGSDVNEYAPTTGVKELREAVAHLYNETYRKGKDSQLYVPSPSPQLPR